MHGLLKYFLNGLSEFDTPKNCQLANIPYNSNNNRREEMTHFVYYAELSGSRGRFLVSLDICSQFGIKEYLLKELILIIIIY